MLKSAFPFCGFGFLVACGFLALTLAKPSAPIEVLTSSSRPRVTLSNPTQTPSDAEFTILGERRTTVKFHHATPDDDKEWILIQQGNWSIRIPIMVESTGIPGVSLPELGTKPSEWAVRKTMNMKWPDDEKAWNFGPQKNPENNLDFEDFFQNNDTKEEGKREKAPPEDELWKDESLWGPVADQDSISRFWSVQRRRKSKAKEEENFKIPPPPVLKSEEVSTEDPDFLETTTVSTQIVSENPPTTNFETENSEFPTTPDPVGGNTVEKASRLRYRPSLWSLPDRLYPQLRHQ